MLRTVLLLTISFGLLSGLLLTSCKALENQQSDDAISIRCGSGGGFTGEESGYEVGPDGLISVLRDGQKSKTGKQLSPEQVQQLWNNAELLQLEELQFMQPGNTYKYLEYEKNGVVNRMAWKDSPKEIAPDGLVLFHRNFTYLVTRQK